MSRSHFPSTNRLRANAQSDKHVGRASRVASVRAPLATGNDLNALPTDLIQEVIELSFFRSPTAATIVGLKRVHPHWRQVIENSTTFKHTEQQPYDVVFGVLVARERLYGDRPNLGTMDLIAIQPPEDAKLRVVPDSAFEDPSGLIVSVDFSA